MLEFLNSNLKPEFLNSNPIQNLNPGTTSEIFLENFNCWKAVKGKKIMLFYENKKQSASKLVKIVKPHWGII